MSEYKLVSITTSNKTGKKLMAKFKNKKTGKKEKRKEYSGFFISLHHLIRWLVKYEIADSKKVLSLKQFIGEFNCIFRRIEIALGLDEKHLKI